MVLKIFLNTADRGEYFVILASDGDALLRGEDLLSVGFRAGIGGSERSVEGVAYISLISLSPAVTFAIDERELALRITADPTLLEKTTVDLGRKTPVGVLSTNDGAAFVNYSLRYTAGDDFEFAALTIPWEVGVSAGGWLGFSSFSYTDTEQDEKFVRLFSNLTADDRGTLTRVVVGDFSAFSGDLGGGGVLAGVSLSKDYAIEPSVVRFPGLGLSGVLNTPSDVELYVNDVLSSRQHLSAGEFQFLNVPGAIGSGDASLVITDAYGRQQTVELPFYVSTQLLKAGLHDYSYNVGLERRGLGDSSFHYGDPVFVGFHRYGFSDAFTGGLRAEADQDLLSLGPSATFLPSNLGETTASIAVSDATGTYGYGGSLSHFYGGDYLSGSFSFRWLSRNYANLNLTSSSDRPRFEGTVGLGCNLRSFGSISARYSLTEFYLETDRRSAAVFYSRRLWKDASLQVRASRTKSDTTVNEVFAGLVVFLGPRRSGTLSHDIQHGSAVDTASIQQNPPRGSGSGYRFLVERDGDQRSDGDISGSGSVQYRGPYGIYAADYNRAAGHDIFDMNVSGGIAFINNSAHLTRPITDAFALVKVGKVSGVSINYSNQEVAMTNADGEAIVPDLISYYDNDLSIEADDLPINYDIEQIQRHVSPPVRGGSIVRFAVTKVQAIVGRLSVVEHGKRNAAQYWGLRIWIDDTPKEFTVGKGGEFYLENLPAGRYGATLFWPDKECNFELSIPGSDEMMVDIGELTCEII